MTRVYYQAGRLRLRVLLLVALVLSLFGVANIAAYAAFFDMQGEQILRQILVFAALIGGVFAVLGLHTWSALRPVAQLLVALREHGVGGRHEDDAQRAALRFPLTFAVLAMVVGTVANLMGLTLDVTLGQLRLTFAVGLAFATETLLMATTAFIYLVLRSIMRPVVAHFRHERVPSGIRVTINTKVTFAIVSLCLAVSIPTALIGSRRLRSMQRQDHQELTRYLTRALIHGARSGGASLECGAERLCPTGGEGCAKCDTARVDRRAPTENLHRTIAAVHLSHGGRIRVLEHSGRATRLEVLAHAPPTHPQLSLVLLLVLVFGLAIHVGRRLAMNISQDVNLLTTRIRQLAQVLPFSEQQLRPLLAEAPQFSDLRRLANALNDLFTRIVEINVTHFLAIEKTLEADRVKTQFLANFSHDLRSPLNSVLGFSQLLLRDMEHLNARQTRDLQVIYRCGNELLLLINQVLDSAKIDAGRMALQREDALPAELLSQALKETRRRGVLPQIQIETELQAGMQAVTVDPLRLAQAMTYILQFCVDSMDRGRIVVKFRLQSTADPASGEKRRHLIFRAATTTGGLQDQDLQRLFHGFRRKPGRRGLGLELPLARSLAGLHDGTLEVSSSVGMGSTFTLDIPLLQPMVLAQLRR